MAGLAERGAEGILLGCTEIDLLVGPDDAPVPVFDTTRLHARAPSSSRSRPGSGTASRTYGADPPSRPPRVRPLARPDAERGGSVV